MKFVAGKLNGQYLENIHQQCIQGCESIKVAVAYADNSKRSFFESCEKSGLMLEYYGRIDHTVPVSPDIMKWFLDRKNPNLQCKLIHKFFHAKVIWWVGAGAYVGSANITDRSWFQNIEAGAFYTHSELTEFSFDQQLDDFFTRLDECAFRLSEEIYLHQKGIKEKRKQIDKLEQSLKNDFESSNLFPKMKSIVSVDQKKSDDKKYEAFRKEWNETLTIMRDISSLVNADEYRPNWVNGDAPGGAVSDRFLHLYYQNVVREGVSYPFEKHFELNRNNPQKALKESLLWWKSGDYSHDYENLIITEWSVRLRDFLSKERILKLSKAEFKEMIGYVHAIRDHATKCSKDMLGMSAKSNHSKEEMIERFGEWIWSKKSAEGNSLLHTLNYVIWGDGEVTSRLWNGTRSEKWRIPHIGMSALGEILGWARPDDYPPRNMRTSKALRAIGYDVKVYNI